HRCSTSLLLQCGQTILFFSYSEIVMIFENSLLQARQRKLYWGMTASPSKTHVAKILIVRAPGVNRLLDASRYDPSLNFLRSTAPAKSEPAPAFQDCSPAPSRGRK